MFKYLKRFNEAIELKEKKNKSKKERSPYYILTYHYMIGDANGYTKEKVKVSADNPFLERFCKILNSLKPNSKSWGVMLTKEDIISFFDEKQITKDEYLFLMRTLFEYRPNKEWSDYFKTDEENSYADEFYEGVRSNTEYSFLVFEYVKLKYVDEYGNKIKAKIKNDIDSSLLNFTKEYELISSKLELRTITDDLNQQMKPNEIQELENIVSPIIKSKDDVEYEDDNSFYFFTKKNTSGYIYKYDDKLWLIYIPTSNKNSVEWIYYKCNSLKAVKNCFDKEIINK